MSKYQMRLFASAIHSVKIHGHHLRGGNLFLKRLEIQLKKD